MLGNPTMQTQARREVLMQNQRTKPTDSGSPSQESLYQMMLLQQQQDASFRLRLGGNLHGHPSLSGLRDFALSSSFGYSPMVPNAIDYSRQQLLQSIIAAEEQQLQQRRFAMQEQLVRQREQLAMQQYAQGESSLFSDMHQAYPQDLSKSNILVSADEFNERKRSYEESLSVEPVKREEHPEVKDSPKPASMPSQEAKEEEKGVQAHTPPAPKRSKPAPKKKAKKSAKPEDVTPASSEPKKDTKWLLMLEELKEYKAVHGNCIVPRGFSPNPRLASWVAEQR